MNLSTTHICETADEWSTEVSTGDGSFVVSWCRWVKGDDAIWNYSCTCKWHRDSGGMYCKHINSVVMSGIHCGWRELLDGRPPEIVDGKKVCPRCKGPVIENAK